MRYLLATLLAVSVCSLPWLAVNNPNQAQYVFNVIQDVGQQLASVILSHKPKTVTEIRSHYTAVSPVQKKVRILIVPGHEPDFGGAEFGTLKERDMAVELSEDLAQFLRNDSHYEVILTRDTHGWNQKFSEYFQNNWNSIIEWQKASHDEVSHLISIGAQTRSTPKVIHNSAPKDVAYRLYGITKWSNENNIDIVIHVHFNDYPRRQTKLPGEHSGFAIYVPASQYGNSATTKAVADTIFKRLGKYDPVSDLPGESTGIVDEPDLIAIGANNTADAASMLIEYSYIYEPRLTNTDIRSLVLKDMAFQTFLGLQDFFDPHNVVSKTGAYDTLIIPHSWISPLKGNNAAATDVFALQTALLVGGEYPPSNKSKNDCPRSGTIGACTRAALDSFQNKYGISGEKGIVGEKTLEVLNKLYSL
jgi:N-acetylmuramoyl-L-alanine amidase